MPEISRSIDARFAVCRILLPPSGERRPVMVRLWFKHHGMARPQSTVLVADDYQDERLQSATRR